MIQSVPGLPHEINFLLYLFIIIFIFLTYENICALENLFPSTIPRHLNDTIISPSVHEFGAELYGPGAEAVELHGDGGDLIWF